MTDDTPTSLPEALAEIERLRARIIELEAAAAVTHGTLEQPTPTPDEPMTIVHDVAPNAPR